MPLTHYEVRTFRTDSLCDKCNEMMVLVKIKEGLFSRRYKYQCISCDSIQWHDTTFPIITYERINNAKEKI